MLKIKKTDPAIYCFLFILYVRFSFICYNMNEIYIDITILFVCILYQVITKKKVVLSLSSLILCGVLLLFALTSCVLNKSIAYNDLKYISQVFLVMVFVSSFSKDVFCENYVNVIYILAIFSLIGFGVSLLLPDIAADRFPEIHFEAWHGAHTKGNYRNLYISVVDVVSRYKRNMGIFYEPGIFALFLNIALFIELLINEKKRLPQMVFITIAVITTLSTNGLITLLLIYFVFFVQKEKKEINNTERMSYFKKKKMKRFLLSFSFFVSCAVLAFFVANPDNWTFLVGKLSEYKSGVTRGSGIERFAAIEKSLVALKNCNLLVGMTAANYSKFLEGAIASFTPTQWFVYYGFFSGLLLNMGLFLFALRKKSGVFVNILRVVAMFSIFASQNVDSNLFVISIIFYELNERLNTRRVEC